MYKLVATDMDETFLDHGHQIPEANIRAMQRMKELGVLFVPSSGRWYSSIMDNFAHLDPALLEGSYVISYNGGFINRVGDPKPLTSCGIGRACAEELYALGCELGKCMHVNVADGHVFVCDAPEAERTYLEKISGVTHFNSAEHTDLSFLDGRDIVKVLFMDPDFEGLQQLGLELEPMARRLGVEFMPAGIDKGYGLKKLAEMLGIPMDQVIGVGDSANDLAMIKAAGLGVGVANVTDDVRPYCDAVLESTGDEGAFEELVEKYLEPSSAL